MMNYDYRFLARTKQFYPKQESKVLPQLSPPLQTPGLWVLISYQSHTISPLKACPQLLTWGNKWAVGLGGHRWGPGPHWDRLSGKTPKGAKGPKIGSKGSSPPFGGVNRRRGAGNAVNSGIKTGLRKVCRRVAVDPPQGCRLLHV